MKIWVEGVFIGGICVWEEDLEEELGGILWYKVSLYGDILHYFPFALRKTWDEDLGVKGVFIGGSARIGGFVLLPLSLFSSREGRFRGRFGRKIWSEGVLIGMCVWEEDLEEELGGTLW